MYPMVHIPWYHRMASLKHWETWEAKVSSVQCINGAWHPACRVGLGCKWRGTRSVGLATRRDDHWRFQICKCQGRDELVCCCPQETYECWNEASNLLRSPFLVRSWSMDCIFSHEDRESCWIFSRGFHENCGTNGWDGDDVRGLECDTFW